ncbi:MAG: MBL fold metallo-hydrolase [Pseudomonadota bacterium]
MRRGFCLPGTTAPSLKGLAFALAIALAVAGLARAAAAQSETQEQAQKLAPDRCLALASGPRRSLVHRAAATEKLAPYQVRVTFLGHATMLIESPKGVKAATDYALPIPAPNIPNIVTMNIAHSSHHTYTPQKEITHVLEGWNTEAGARLHDVTVEDMRVRNVPTNIRSWGGETREFGNSVFIFEVGALCIAHLGHLHHTLTTQQLAGIGQMDIVFAPVDGSWTLDYPGMREVLKAMNPRYIIPMHYFTMSTLERFLTLARPDYKVTFNQGPTVVISKDRLPEKTEILVLPGN